MTGAEIFLMSPPDFYGAHFMFNPWLDYREEVDTDRAHQQWSSLVEALTGLGASIEILEPNPSSSAQVFTADGAVALGESHFLVLRNDGARGVLEPERFSEWLERHGHTIELLPPRYRLDGGNIVPLASDVMGIGVKPGAGGASEQYLERLFSLVSGTETARFKLVDRRFLHLDMVLGRLGDAALLVHSQGFEDPDAARRQLERHNKPIIHVDLDDAQGLACNGVTVGNTFVTNSASRELKRRIHGVGFEVLEVDVGEFLKAGGGVRCLTMALTGVTGGTNNGQ